MAERRPLVVIDGRIQELPDGDTLSGGSGGGGAAIFAWAVQATGTGSSQAITIPYDDMDPVSVLVFVDGLRYELADYSISGDQLTLTAGSGDSIEIIGPEASGGSVPGTTPVVRGGTIFRANASSFNVPIPVAAVAGDLAVIFGGSGWGVNAPSGWGQLDKQDGTNFNGGIFYKVLDSTDIFIGYVTITTSASYYGVFSMVAFEGPTGGFRTVLAQRSAGGASTRSLVTDSSPQANDMAIFFGAGRGNSLITVNIGTAEATISGTESSGATYSYEIPSSGLIAPTFAYSVTPGGDYQALIVVKPV